MVGDDIHSTLQELYLVDFIGYFSDRGCPEPTPQVRTGSFGTDVPEKYEKLNQNAPDIIEFGRNQKGGVDG